MIGVSANGLVMRFDGVTAVDDVTFDVAPGEFVTLLGPSGCGKTTLLKMISGFLQPHAGSIRLGDEDITRVPPEARDTALCFQSYALFPHLSVRENLEFGLRQKRLSRDERRRRVEEVASTLELDPQMDKLPNQLSGGQQQRVSLGRALVMRPGVILFDEPLSNLDARLRDQVRILIRRVQRDFGLTAIYVTHDQSEALALSDRIFVMNAGRVEQADTPEALYYRPRTGFVADFIGGANILRGRLTAQTAPGEWAVDTPIGVLTARVDAPRRGAEVHLCWRPETAELAADGLPAQVLHRAFQGHFTDLAVATNGVPYRIQVPRTQAREGDEIRFRIAPEHVVVLEAGP
ncbi:ABC transporter ATP-binding protein [Salinarimonas ramus]|uniref:ABC transporter ATP-binding protein n=1 Tax=Salinarimonas ramus TaxID=690164 RepID=A0A917V9I3_9HYPH|nr:ABC transporter ATP-binding protein [Salinarimonas ramus]GGK51698.1 ABC transporter ATP-binding protein [Salinarimonas ramus]